MKTVNLKIPKGSTIPINFTLTDRTGNILTLTANDKVYFTVKKKATDTTPILQKSLVLGVSKGITQNATTKEITVSFVGTDTDSLNAQTYFYDVKTVLYNGDSEPIRDFPVCGDFELISTGTRIADEV